MDKNLEQMMCQSELMRETLDKYNKLPEYKIIFDSIFGAYMKKYGGCDCDDMYKMCIETDQYYEKTKK